MYVFPLITTFFIVPNSAANIRNEVLPEFSQNILNGYIDIALNNQTDLELGTSLQVNTVSKNGAGHMTGDVIPDVPTLSVPKQLLSPVLSRNIQTRKSNPMQLRSRGTTYQVLTKDSVPGSNEPQFLTLAHAEAVAACKNTTPDPSHLLTIRSEKENKLISTWLFNDLKITSKVWLSLKRVNGTNDFVWPNGVKLLNQANNMDKESGAYKNWHKCEPNDFLKWGSWAEECVEMYSHQYPYRLRCDEKAKAGQWNDIPCTDIFNVVVCQTDIRIKY